MKKEKFSKRLVKVAVIIIIGLCVLNVAINGINIVPSGYRNLSVSFLTPDLDWCSRPSDVILKYGLPKTVSEKSEINGSRDFEFDFIYDGKQVEFTACNRIFINNNFSTYYFYVDCKTPEEAEKFFYECKEKTLEFYGDKGIFACNTEDDDDEKHCFILLSSVAVEFSISYTEDDPVVFIKSLCQY